MQSNTRSLGRVPASWIEEHAPVGVRFVRGGRVVSLLELGLRGPVCAQSLREAVLERLFQLRVQLVRWERALGDSLDLHRLTLVEFDGASLGPNRRGNIASEMRGLVMQLVGTASAAPVIAPATRGAKISTLRVGVAAA